MLISSSSDAVGVATHVVNLAVLLSAHGLLDLVVCPRKGWLTNELERDNIPYEVIHMSFNPVEYIGCSSALVKFVRSRNSPVILHFHGRMTLFLGLPLVLRRRGNTNVVTLHQFPSPSTDGILRWKTRLETLILERVDRVCCVSEALGKETVKRLGNPSRVQYISNWIRPLKSSRERESDLLSGLAEQQPFPICGVGRLAREKGFDLLIRAVDHLRSRGYEVRCDIYGSGPEKESLLNEINSHLLSDTVALKGEVRDVRLLLPQYRVLVIPSRNESFGLVALEAYDAGTAVVASDVPGLNEVVRGNETGLLARPGDPESIADQIEVLLKSTEIARRLVANGRKVLLEYYDLERLYDQFMEFYGLPS